MSSKNTTLVSQVGGQTAFEMSAPPMIGVLPATTVVYILLGFGALLPILLLAVVAVTLCVRRRSRKSSAVVPVISVGGGVAGYHSNADGFDADDDDDVFCAKEWTEQHVWDTTLPTAVDFGVDYRKRMAELAGKAEVHSVQNPNVYFRHSRLPPPPKLDAEYSGVPSTSSSVHLEPSELFALSNYEPPGTPPPSDDVTMTSYSRSDAATSGQVVASTGWTFDTQRVATIDRDLSMTRSTLQREEEQVLR